MIELVANEIGIHKKVKSSEEFTKELVIAVEELLQKNFPRLVQVLYRLDVDEEKLKRQLRDNQSMRAAEVIARMIIDRQIEKQEARKNFGSQGNVSEEEKW